MPPRVERHRTMRIKNLRWWIAGLLFLGTELNYIDRNVLAVLEPRIKQELAWTSKDWGLITGAFLLAYALFALPTGRLVDKIGTKYGYMLMLGWWGAACALHGFAGSVAAFVVLRFALGMGEAGLVPATAKACAEWFPPRERGFAYGLAASGMMIGGIVTPPLTGYIADHLGWQFAFFFTGALCVLWICAWQFLFGDPATHRLLTEPEREHILTKRDAECGDDSAMPAAGRIGIGSLVALPQVWGIAAARFLADSVWFFFLFWTPKYLKEARGIAVSTIDNTVWLPFLAAAIASFGSGSLSSFLIKRGMHPVQSRKVVLVIGAALLPLGTMAFFADSYPVALACLCAAAFGHTFWVVATQTLPGDMFPGRYVGTATGFAQMTSAIGGALAMYGIGHVVYYVSYEPVFILAGLLHPIGTVLMLLTVRHTDAMRQRLLEQEETQKNALRIT
jgi:MFS transporter, ACS family, hexuronate transporter